MSCKLTFQPFVLFDPDPGLKYHTGNPHFEMENIYIYNKVVTKSGMGIWELGLGNVGTWKCGDLGTRIRDVGREDVGTQRHTGTRE